MLGPILQWVNKIYQTIDSNLTHKVDADVSTRSSHSAQDVANLAGLKSVQRGSSTLSGSSGSTISISSVNTSKSFLVMNYSSATSVGAVKGWLRENNELRFERESTSTSDYSYVRWEVVEFE